MSKCCFRVINGNVGLNRFEYFSSHLLYAIMHWIFKNTRVLSGSSTNSIDVDVTLNTIAFDENMTFKTWELKK